MPGRFAALLDRPRDRQNVLTVLDALRSDVAQREPDFFAEMAYSLHNRAVAPSHHPDALDIQDQVTELSRTGAATPQARTREANEQPHPSHDHIPPAGKLPRAAVRRFHAPSLCETAPTSPTATQNGDPSDEVGDDALELELPSPSSTLSDVAEPAARVFSATAYGPVHGASTSPVTPLQRPSKTLALNRASVIDTLCASTTTCPAVPSQVSEQPSTSKATPGADFREFEARQDCLEEITTPVLSEDAMPEGLPSYPTELPKGVPSNIPGCVPMLMRRRTKPAYTESMHKPGHVGEAFDSAQGTPPREERESAASNRPGRPRIGRNSQAFAPDARAQTQGHAIPRSRSTGGSFLSRSFTKVMATIRSGSSGSRTNSIGSHRDSGPVDVQRRADREGADPVTCKTTMDVSNLHRPASFYETSPWFRSASTKGSGACVVNRTAPCSGNSGNARWVWKSVQREGGRGSDNEIPTGARESRTGFAIPSGRALDLSDCSDEDSTASTDLASSVVGVCLERSTVMVAGASTFLEKGRESPAPPMAGQDSASGHRLHRQAPALISAAETPRRRTKWTTTPQAPRHVAARLQWPSMKHEQAAPTASTAAPNQLAHEERSDGSPSPHAASSHASPYIRHYASHRGGMLQARENSWFGFDVASEDEDWDDRSQNRGVAVPPVQVVRDVGRTPLVRVEATRHGADGEHISAHEQGQLENFGPVHVVGGAMLEGKSRLSSASSSSQTSSGHELGVTRVRRAHRAEGRRNRVDQQHHVVISS